MTVVARRVVAVVRERVAVVHRHLVSRAAWTVLTGARQAVVATGERAEVAHRGLVAGAVRTALCGDG